MEVSEIWNLFIYLATSYPILRCWWFLDFKKFKFVYLSRNLLSHFSLLLFFRYKKSLFIYLSEIWNLFIYLATSYPILSCWWFLDFKKFKFVYLSRNLLSHFSLLLFFRYKKSLFIYLATSYPILNPIIYLIIVSN